jgi:hypothetical protein
VRRFDVRFERRIRRIWARLFVVCRVFGGQWGHWGCRRSLCRLIAKALGQNSQYLPGRGSRFVPIRSIDHVLTKKSNRNDASSAPGFVISSISAVPLPRSRMFFIGGRKGSRPTPSPSRYSGQWADYFISVPASSYSRVPVGAVNGAVLQPHSGAGSNRTYAAQQQV